MSRVPTLKPRVHTIGSRLGGKRSQQPSYRIRGRALQRIREQHLSAHPMCVRCQAQGRVEPAVELDHTIPLSKGGKDVHGNRQGLCIPCHEQKSIEDAREGRV